MVLLGSTGSIGISTLDIVKKFSLSIEALSAGRNIKLLNKQIKLFKPNFVAISDKNLKNQVHHERVFCGNEGILEMLECSQSKTVVNAIVGYAGLEPSIKSLKLGKRLALANKESLVIGGKFLDVSQITPIDSEHFGLKYLLNDKKIKSMTITASGGAFRDADLEKIPKLKLKDALKHPNWKMGQKITIDSATMINKLFELLEAKWLFNAQKYDAVIETSSLIHAFVSFADGSTTAHFAQADMRLPIAYALLGKVDEAIVSSINLQELKSLEFRQIDPKRYPIWEIKDNILQHPELGVVINSANEVAIKKFVKEEINALDISKLIKKAYRKFEDAKISSLEEVFELHDEVQMYCNKG